MRLSIKQTNGSREILLLTREYMSIAINRQLMLVCSIIGVCYNVIALNRRVRKTKT